MAWHGMGCFTVILPALNFPSFSQRIWFDLIFSFFLFAFASATGMVYDVECRDSKTGDAAFLAVSPPIIDSSSVSTISDIKDKDIIASIFGLRGRFSFYGVPTDVKIKKSTIIDNNDDGSSNNYKI